VPGRAQAATVPPGGLSPGQVQDQQAGASWPAAGITAARLRRLPVQVIAVATDGAAASERAQTMLETAYPIAGPAATVAELDGADPPVQTLAMEQQLADVIILASLPIGGCALAAGVAAALSERRRPFSLLRLTGAPLAPLRRWSR